MKKYFALLAVAALFSCTSESKENTETARHVDPELARNFVIDIALLEEVEDPINSFSASANQSAEKQMTVTKDNIKEVLETAKEYTNSVFVKADHTIVIVDNVGECQESGSWDACMPFGRGFIKKGRLNHNEDFINNIIGKPDSQKLTVYFFNL